MAIVRIGNIRKWSIMPDEADLKTYKWWGSEGSPPANLKTRKQLSEMGLSPLKPVGKIDAKFKSKRYTILLYDSLDPESCREMRLTSKQRANRERKRKEASYDKWYKEGGLYEVERCESVIWTRRQLLRDDWVILSQSLTLNADQKGGDLTFSAVDHQGQPLFSITDQVNNREGMSDEFLLRCIEWLKGKRVLYIQPEPEEEDRLRGLGFPLFLYAEQVVARGFYSAFTVFDDNRALLNSFYQSCDSGVFLVEDVFGIWYVPFSFLGDFHDFLKRKRDSLSVCFYDKHQTLVDCILSFALLQEIAADSDRIDLTSYGGVSLSLEDFTQFTSLSRRKLPRLDGGPGSILDETSAKLVQFERKLGRQREILSWFPSKDNLVTFEERLRRIAEHYA